MTEKYLTLGQNLCAARIFLNTFGLILESIKDINEFSKIRVFDYSMNEVGKVYFDNGKVIISASYNNSKLDANFDIAKMSVSVDFENGNALYGQWFSKIIFQLQKEDNVKLSGEFLLESNADSEFGLSCFCHPIINCDIGEGNITLKILRNGRTFGVEASFLNYYETIDIMPWDELNGFIKRVISNKEDDDENKYKKYMGVFSAGKGNEDKLHVFLSEKKGSNQISYRNEFPLKVKENAKLKSLVIQKGMLMQDLDSDMFKRINEIREILLIGNVSLLDNLISVCYDSYTDEEINALLGLNRKRMNYQNAAESLVKSYYEIGISDCFFPIETQKRLLRKLI